MSRLPTNRFDLAAYAQQLFCPAAKPTTTCVARAFVSRTCERGVFGCDVMHDRDHSVEGVLDKLHAAGVEIVVNGEKAP